MSVADTALKRFWSEVMTTASHWYAIVISGFLVRRWHCQNVILGCHIEGPSQVSDQNKAMYLGIGIDTNEDTLMAVRSPDPSNPQTHQITRPSNHQTRQITRPVRSPDPSDHQIPRPVRSPDPSDHQTCQITRPVRSPDPSDHQTYQIPRPTRLPDLSDYQTHLTH